MQPKTNFAGKWTLVPDPSALLASDANELTVTQTADTLITEQIGSARNPAPIRMTYKLDGSETKQVINRADIVTKAYWDGTKLVTTVTGPSANWKDTWSLEGDRLTIVTSTPGRTLTITRTYKKS